MRAGAALALVVLTILALSAVAVAVVLLAMGNARVVGVQVAAERARHGAEYAALRTAASWSTRMVDAWLDTASTDAYAYDRQGADSQRVSIYPVGSGLRLVLAESWVAHRGRPTRGSAALVVRVLSIPELLDGFGAAVVAPYVRVEEDGRIRAGTPRPGGSMGAACADAAEAADTLFGTPAALLSTAPPAIDPAAVVVGAVRDLPTTPALVMDSLFWTAAAAYGRRLPAGTLRRLPGVQSPCPAADPDEPLTPPNGCGRSRPLLYAPGDLVLEGATGGGILLVDGSLAVRDRARFTGVILARGAITITSGAAIHGALRSGVSVAVHSASVWYDLCNIWDAMTEADAFDRAFRTPGRWWIPAF